MLWISLASVIFKEILGNRGINHRRRRRWNTVVNSNVRIRNFAQKKKRQGIRLGLTSSEKEYKFLRTIFCYFLASHVRLNVFYLDHRRGTDKLPRLGFSCNYRENCIGFNFFFFFSHLRSRNKTIIVYRRVLKYFLGQGTRDTGKNYNPGLMMISDLVPSL